MAEEMGKDEKPDRDGCGRVLAGRLEEGES